MGLFGGKKQAVGWHATDEANIIRYFDGQRWRGEARLTALDDLGPLPFTVEAQKQKTIDELVEQESQIEDAVTAASAACEDLGQKRSDLERQIRELRQERAEAVHEDFLREINLRDSRRWPTDQRRLQRRSRKSVHKPSRWSRTDSPLQPIQGWRHSSTSTVASTLLSESTYART